MHGISELLKRVRSVAEIVGVDDAFFGGLPLIRSEQLMLLQKPQVCMRTAVRYSFLFIVLTGSSWLVMNTASATAQLIRAGTPPAVFEAAAWNPELVVEPHLGNSPLALDGPGIASQDPGDFLRAETTEEP
jgi:hypothetical protein